MSYNPQQPLPLPQLPKNQEQSQHLLLDRQPRDELIDFGESNGFLREKNDELGNSLEFGHHENHLEGHLMNFDEKHTHERNHFNQHHFTTHNENKYVHSHVQNQHRQYQHHEQQEQHNEIQSNQNEKKPSSQQPRRKCICKKTQCLKMYCQCFASNLPCTEQCTCLQCKNTLEHQKEIVQAKLLIQQKGVVGLHSCSLSEKRCNCKKSGCLKKYCECYNSGVKCSQGCKCVGCKNCENPKNDNDVEKGQAVTKSKVKAEKKKKQQKVSQTVSHN